MAQYCTAAALLVGACGTTSPTPVAGPGEYVVQPGDTLYRIASKSGRSAGDIARWSNLQDPDRLEAGQVLRVAPPGGASSEASPPPRRSGGGADRSARPPSATARRAGSRTRWCRRPRAAATGAGPRKGRWSRASTATATRASTSRPRGRPRAVDRRGQGGRHGDAARLRQRGDGRPRRLVHVGLHQPAHGAGQAGAAVERGQKIADIGAATPSCISRSATAATPSIRGST
jgi:LysM repeat protein